jgi:hypothetical protein
MIQEVDEMIVMYTLTCPTTSAVEMGKAVVKNFAEYPFPSYIKVIGIYQLFSENGIKMYAILDIEKGKEDDAVKLFYKRGLNYLSVPGYGSKVEILTPMEESLALLGL